MKVREWGPEHGRPLLFWPGLNPWGELQLVEVAPLLAEQGVHVVSIVPPWDLPAPDDYLPSRLAQRILDLGYERFVFMGHSWGASIGVQLAADHPERLEGLVLLDGGYSDVELGDITLDRLVAHFEAEQAATAYDSWDDFRAWVGDRNWERYRAGMVERDGTIVPGSSARAAAWAIWGVAREKQTATHDRLHVPTLLLLARDAEGTIPNAEVHRLDSGHDPAEDQPDETARLVTDWLARLSPT
jgi:pimeloyl-ACP methyl ester carboxylesterase